MEIIRLLTAPIRSIVRFPLVQLAFAIILITALQAANEKSLPGEIFTLLDNLVDSTVQFISSVLTVKSFTRSWLISGFMIIYVYFACLLILSFLRFFCRVIVDLVGRWNLFWLRNAIARERGIVAYRAWLPLERIRPAYIPQEMWEEKFGWPADNSPPYPNLLHRTIRAITSYTIVLILIALMLEAYTPFPVVTWISKLIPPFVKMLPPKS